MRLTSVILLVLVGLIVATSARSPPIKECKERTCKKTCRYGVIFNKKGCPTCRCFNPCKDAELECGVDQYCQNQVATCKTTPCYGTATCADCKKRRCKNDCPEYGYKTNKKGCQTCKCYDPCKDLNCGDDQTCEVQKVLCITTPCPPAVRCVDKEPQCPVFRCKSCPNGYKYENGCQTCECASVCPPTCRRYCQDGYVMDGNNCPTCQCIDVCEGVRCPTGQQCVPNEVKCVTQPCPRQAECRAPECPPTCAIFCQDGNVMDENNCPTCECREPVV